MEPPLLVGPLLTAPPLWKGLRPFLISAPVNSGLAIVVPHYKCPTIMRATIICALLSIALRAIDYRAHITRAPHYCPHYIMLHNNARL